MKNYYDLLRYFADAIPFQKKTTGDWILPAAVGLGLGAAVGVGLGMIFAPAPGVDTRRQLRDVSTRVKDKAFLAANQAKERITHQLSNNVAGNHIAESSYVNDMGEIR